MDNENVFWICIAFIFCTAMGCCTYLEAKKIEHPAIEKMTP